MCSNIRTHYKLVGRLLNQRSNTDKTAQRFSSPIISRYNSNKSHTVGCSAGHFKSPPSAIVVMCLCLGIAQCSQCLNWFAYQVLVLNRRCQVPGEKAAKTTKSAKKARCGASFQMLGDSCQIWQPGARGRRAVDSVENQN